MVAAENQWRNVGFNGPDPYNILSPAAKKWVAEHPNTLVNYRNRADKIGNFGGNRTGVAIFVSMEMGLHPNVLDCHQLSTWQFDQEGKLLIPDNEYNQRALVQQAERMMMNVYTEQMATLNKLKTRFQSNVGGLSKNEQIYLEDSQALAIVQLAATNFDLALEKVMKHYKNGIHELEDLWREGLFALQNITPDLAYDEMIAVIQAVGCTKQTVAIVPAEIFQEKVNQVRQLSNKFTSLKEEIIGKIGQLVQQDHELASQIV